MLNAQYWNIEWHDSVTDSSSMVKGQMLWKPKGGEISLGRKDLNKSPELKWLYMNLFEAPFENTPY